MVQTPLDVAQASWLKGGGSSTSSNASDQFDASSRLLMGEELVMEKLSAGTTWPTAVGVPPVQVTRTSPTGSASPGVRRLATLDAFMEHWSAWAEASEASNANTSTDKTDCREKVIPILSLIGERAVLCAP